MSTRYIVTRVIGVQCYRIRRIVDGSRRKMIGREIFVSLSLGDGRSNVSLSVGAEVTLAGEGFR